MLKGVKQLWPGGGGGSGSHSHSQNNQQSSQAHPQPSPGISPSPSFSGPLDQATPRASAQPTPNPFDLQPPPPIGGGSAGHSMSHSPTNSLHMPSGLRTPTTHTFPLMTPPIMGTPGAAAPTTQVTVGDSAGFGLHEPPKMRRALSKLNDDGQTSPQTPTQELADPTAALNLGSSGNHPPHNPERAPRGTLAIKIISARNLAVSTQANAPQPQPYVVITFEQNEFISRPPHPVSSTEQVGFTTSEAQPKTGAQASGGLNIPKPKDNGPLGMGTITRAFADAARRTKGSKTPTANKSGAVTPELEPQQSWMGKPKAGDPIWKEEVSFDLTSSNSVVHVTVYDRSKAGEGFLGMLDIKPVLKDGYTLDNWYKLETRGEEHVTGELWLQMTYTMIRNKVHLKPSDFEFLKLIGRGTFGRVFQVRKRDTHRIYAMKVLSKKEIVAKKEVAHTIGERKILQRSLECPFLVGLKFSFQTDKELYFVTDYKSGGELFWHLQREGRFEEKRARFYIAELILALEHLHKFNIVYRDLKPENILLDATGHVALCDFGLSKPDLSSDQLTNTFCGTTEYLAPEVLLDEKGYGKHVDFWSLGVLLFEMCCGWSPFYAEETQTMYKLICYGKIRFPKHVIGDDGKQFVKSLLNRNPQHRLGAQRDAAELKEHPFFKSIDWDLLAKKQITPPFKPVVDSDESVANFDPEFTNSSLTAAGINPFSDDDPYEAPAAGGHSYVGPGGSLSKGSAMPIKPQRPNPLGNGSPLTSSVQENFRGFTYTGESLMPTSQLGEYDVDDEDSDSDMENAVDDDEFDAEEDDGMRTRRQSDVDMDH